MHTPPPKKKNRKKNSWKLLGQMNFKKHGRFFRNHENPGRTFVRAETIGPRMLGKRKRTFEKMFKLFVLKKEQGNANSFSQDSVINSIGEFIYSPEEDVSFVAHFRRYEEVFQKDCATWSDEKNTSVVREIQSKRPRKVC